MLATGLAVLAASTLGLILLVEPVLGWYYQLAWWSYIVAADGLNRRLCGRSLIRDQPRRFLWMCALSVAWWCVFEAINLRLGNWYYVMDHAGRAQRWAGGVAAFATVLPGIVETLELAENLRLFQRARVARIVWTRGRDVLCLALGLLFFALPLLWPGVFFPLTWGSFALLLEPWNRRHARRSFLRDLEAGEAGPLLRTLAAGLVCGLLWELWNQWARSKWIYTVPGLELKLFEMPLPGFLGFPPFAVECLVVLRFAKALAGRLAARGRGAVLAGGSLALAGGAAFTLAVFAAGDAVTVDSFHVPVGDLRVLPAPLRQRLDALGLHGQEKLLRALREGPGRREWARRSGLSEAELGEAWERVALVAHRGIGEQRALQLARLGVRTRQDLLRWRAADLAAALRAQGTTARERFLERRVRVWLEGL